MKKVVWTAVSKASHLAASLAVPLVLPTGILWGALKVDLMAEYLAS